jgi:type IV pilus assembly protein PilA
MNSRNSNFGFTLIELMAVVAIIGIVVSIAIPSFKKYQARSRTIEAKLTLTNVYVAEQNMFSEFNTYAECIGNFGVDCPGLLAVAFFPPCSMPNNYYSIMTTGATGWPMPTDWGDKAIQKKGGAACFGGAFGSTSSDKSLYLGSKLPAGTTLGPDLHTLILNSNLTKPTTINADNFEIVAGGFVSPSGVINGTADVDAKADKWSINEGKRFVHLQTGY